MKFLIEKFEKEIQELPDEETNLYDKKLSDVHITYKIIGMKKDIFLQKSI